MQRYYPLMISVQDRTCLVVGGGTVGERRAGGLLEAGASVVLVCPEILSARLLEWKKAGAVRHLPKPFSPEDLDGAALVIAATGSSELNGWICDEAAERGIPANSATDAGRGSFIVPAVVRRGGLVLSVSASGAGPALSARIAGELKAKYGPEYGELTSRLGAVRKAVLSEVTEKDERRRLLNAAVADRAIASWLAMKELPATDELVQMLKDWADVP